MIWETPIVEDIACGMEVTSYAPAVEAVETMDDTSEMPLDDRDL